MRDSENLAMLVDRENYWLNSEYSSWVTDPDDPAVKAERARRKKQGIRPAPVPILPPVALRPPDLAELRNSQYEEAIAEHAAAGPVHVGGDIKAGSVRELLQILDARDAAR
ncbi:hypothetical protein M1M07_07735 [Rhodococcus sp. HM1]|uniref:hypothetical protein n=1 Tax=Rhodococcus sp. HM1 TaxID=2937759 RepID=UPI002009E505|nr:hypothetical protein [Rhodococcus sp. HM1]MCK8671008.1 hypothetical protein [Rhodococcus sp. HM1]